MFTPAVQPPAAPAAKPVVVAGTLIIRATASLKAIPASQIIHAFPSAYLYDDGYRNSLGTEVTAKRSGDKATVDVSFSYIFTAQKEGEPVTVEVDFSTQKPPYPFAELTKTIPLPANGTTTVVTLPATL